MDRKSIIAFVVIGVIIILMPYYQKILNPVDETAIVQQETTAAVQQDVVASTPPPEYVRPQVSIETSEQPVNSKDIIVVNNKFAMRLSNLGGGTIREYELFNYSDLDGNRVRLLSPEANANLNIEYTNLYQDPSNLEYIAFDCPRIDRYSDVDTLFVDGETTLTYTALSAEGVKSEKTFTFYPDKYDFQLNVALADYLQKMAVAAIKDKYPVKINDGIYSNPYSTSFTFSLKNKTLQEKTVVDSSQDISAKHNFRRMDD